MIPFTENRNRIDTVTLLDAVNHIQPFSDPAEHSMLAVQMRLGGMGDEELGAVRVGPAVGHAQHPRAVVLRLEVLVVELLAVDALPVVPVAGREVPALRTRLEFNSGCAEC